MNPTGNFYSFVFDGYEERQKTLIILSGGGDQDDNHSTWPRLLLNTLQCFFCRIKKMNVKGQQDRSLEKEKRETHIDYETLSNAKRTDF